MFFGIKNKNRQYEVKMVYDKSKPLSKRSIIEFLKSSGIEVKTNTKARGNQGLYQKNRIDVSRHLKEERAIEVLVHEFAHHIHCKIDKDFLKNGGTIQTLFDTDDIKEIKAELINVTKLIDKNSCLTMLLRAKEETAKAIKAMHKSIQSYYPDFMRSKRFLQFEKYIKNSDARYLVKYDAIKISKGFFFKRDKLLSVKYLERDFPEMPKAFQQYIKLCSAQRKQKKITRRINKLNKYYESPSELFARFVQGCFFAPETILSAAPLSAKRFKELLKSGYYGELKDFFEIFKN